MVNIIIPLFEVPTVFIVSSVIQFTFSGCTGPASDFHVIADAIMFHEAKRSAEVHLDKFDGSYHVIDQSFTVKNHGNSELQVTARIC